MLIWEMAFVFHKSKQVKTRVGLKKLSKKTEVITSDFVLCL